LGLQSVLENMHACQTIIDRHGGIKHNPNIQKIEYTQTDGEDDVRDSIESDSGLDDDYVVDDLDSLFEEQNLSDYNKNISFHNQR
jgi:hypothetical protein